MFPHSLGPMYGVMARMREECATVRRFDPSAEAFLGIVQGPSGVRLYTRDRTGRWARSTTNQEAAGAELNELLDWLVEEAERRDETELHGWYGSDGPRLYSP